MESAETKEMRYIIQISRLSLGHVSIVGINSKCYRECFQD